MQRKLILKQWKLTQAPFTLVRFRFKTHKFCYGHAGYIVYTTHEFSRLKTETFENAADPVLFWKFRGFVLV